MGKYGGPYPWQLVVGKLSFFTLWYPEEPDAGLTCDTPAVGEDGMFLWCQDEHALLRLSTHCAERLSRLGFGDQEMVSMDVLKILEGLRHEDGRSENRWETVDLLNILWDYLAFLPLNPEVAADADLIGELSDNLFEGKGLNTFCATHRTNHSHVLGMILRTLYLICSHSRLITLQDDASGA